MIQKKFSYSNKRFALRVTAGLALISALAISGCGGGGNSDIGTSIAVPPSTGPASGAADISIIAGDSIVVPGTLTTTDNLLTSIGWSVTSQNPLQPPLILANDKCDVAVKNDSIFVPQNGQVTTKTGSSNWRCDLQVLSPAAITANTTYTLSLNGKDNKGNTQSIQKVLLVNLAPVLPNASVGQPIGTPTPQDFSVFVGDKVPLACNSGGVGVNTFQWKIDASGGIPVDLSSYTTQATSFIAPPVAVSTVVSLSCRATDTKNITIATPINITVKPVANTTNTLVTAITGDPAAKVGRPGDVLTLTGTAAFYDSKAAIAPGPVISYNWTLGAGAPAGTVIQSPNSLSTGIILDRSVTSPVFFPVTLTATSGVQTSSATTTLLIDPNGALNPSVEPQAQVVVGGSTVKIAAKPKLANLYYQWTVVSGPSVILGGGNTDTVGFIAPTVPPAAAGMPANSFTIVLRVAIGYVPITTQNPGVYFVDSVVRVN